MWVVCGDLNKLGLAKVGFIGMWEAGHYSLYPQIVETGLGHFRDLLIYYKVLSYENQVFIEWQDFSVLNWTNTFSFYFP